MHKDIQLLITCEHGGKQIPQLYRRYFKGKEEILKSHRGYDPGALDIARVIAEKTRSPIVFEKISRLLIEQNRSRKSKAIFSEYVFKMSQEEIHFLFETVYDPYHEKVTSCISENIKNSKMTFHFSIHTFTPEMQGQERNADLGLLYDPSRVMERDICAAIKEKITDEISGIKVRKNYPYRGISDGLTTALRKRYSEKYYCGIEIEINQKHFFANSKIWMEIKKKLPACLGSIGENIRN